MLLALKILLSFIIVLQIVNFTHEKGQYDIKFTFGIFLKHHMIRISYEPIIGQCVRRCFMLKACKSLHYHKIYHVCTLNNVSSSEAGSECWETNPYVVFGDKTEWPKEIGGSCADDPCPITSRCIPTSPHKCVAWCGMPRMVSNTDLSVGGDTRGSQRKYRCKPGFVMNGTGTIICKYDSSWSQVNFNCFSLGVSLAFE